MVSLVVAFAVFFARLICRPFFIRPIPCLARCEIRGIFGHFHSKPFAQNSKVVTERILIIERGERHRKVGDNVAPLTKAEMAHELFSGIRSELKRLADQHERFVVDVSVDVMLGAANT